MLNMHLGTPALWRRDLSPLHSIKPFTLYTCLSEVGSGDKELLIKATGKGGAEWGQGADGGMEIQFGGAEGDGGGRLYLASS